MTKQDFLWLLELLDNTGRFRVDIEAVGERIVFTGEIGLSIIVGSLQLDNVTSLFVYTHGDMLQIGRPSTAFVFTTFEKITAVSGSFISP